MWICPKSVQKSPWKILIIVILALTGIQYFRLNPSSYEVSNLWLNPLSNEVSDLQLYPSSEQDAFEQWKLTMEDRKQRVKEVCRKHSKDLSRQINVTSVKEGLLYDVKHNLAYCRNSKVGTTTWLTDLLQDAGFSEKTITNFKGNIHILAREDVFPPLPYKRAVERMNHPDQLQFTVVRHPFIRLVSAYRNIVLNSHLLRPIYPKIIEKYRDGSDYKTQAQGQANVSQDTSKPSFREITLFMADAFLACPKLNRECFEEINIHWRPMYYRCAPCNIRYDVISKMETFNEDKKYIRQLAAGLPSKRTSVETNVNRRGPSEDLGLIKTYFSLLSEAEKQKIYKAYFYDFELFGYSFDIAEAEDIQSLLL